MISVDPLKENNILYLKVLSDEIDFSPDYQRESDIWPLSKKQLFIDSLINGIDIPKLYFHEVKKTTQYTFRYAVVDGKQRLETIFSFLNDKFAVSDEFTDFSGENIDVKGKKYSEFSKVSSKFKASFDAKQLPIYVIRTDDPDLIDEMFYRLNEAAPLNAAEKRNSFKGPYPKLVRDFVSHPFFQSKVSFSSRRYKHHDAIGKLMLIICLGQIVDTKKIHLDNFARQMLNFSEDLVAKIENKTRNFLDVLDKIFINNDPLLRSPAVLPVLLIITESLEKKKLIDLFERDLMEGFEQERISNRILARENEENEKINYDLLEYDRLIQSPNDSSSIKFRAAVLEDYLMTKLQA